MADDVEQLEAAIGRAAREIREAAGITLDQLATRAREHGLRWSTARVIEFEKGQMRVTLPLLLTVAQSLAQLTGRQLALPDLIPEGSSWLQVTDEWITKRGMLRESLRGMPVALPQVVEVSNVEPGTNVTVVDLEGRSIRHVLGAGNPPPADALVPTLAEERAARRLGVRPRQIAMWAEMLWGRHLDDEVASRAGGDASPQARGHVTRQLVDAIKEQIDAYGDSIVEARTRFHAGERSGNR